MCCSRAVSCSSLRTPCSSWACADFASESSLVYRVSSLSISSRKPSSMVWASSCSLFIWFFNSIFSCNYTNMFIWFFNSIFSCNYTNMFIWFFNSIFSCNYTNMFIWFFNSIFSCNYTNKEGNVLFNDALITFYLRLYGVRHMVKDHSDSERGNPLPPHGLIFSISYMKIDT